MRIEVLPRQRVNVFAVSRCGVGQHHPDGLVQLAAVYAYACVVHLPRTLMRGVHPARDRRAAGLDQRQVERVDERSVARGVDVAETGEEVRDHLAAPLDGSGGLQSKPHGALLDDACLARQRLADVHGHLGPETQALLEGLHDAHE